MQIDSTAYLPAGNSLRLSGLVASNSPVTSIVWKKQEAGFSETEYYEIFPKGENEHGACLALL